MKKKYENVLNEMLQDADVKGKKFIENIIWLNNVKPKYKVGDKVLVTDRGYYIYGNRVINFGGVVAEVKKDATHKDIIYKVNIECECENDNVSTYVWGRDAYMKKTQKKNLVNKVVKKDKYRESMIM